VKTVYRLTTDIDNYQYFLTEPAKDMDKFDADCRRKGKSWMPPKVFVYEPHLLRGDFFNTISAYLITSPKATKVLKSYLEDAGEILSLPFEGDTFGFINVLRCYDCLDKSKTTWRESGLPQSYVFDFEKLPYPGIFKIPSTHTGETLLLVDSNAPESDNFIRAVQKAELKSLNFELIWEEKKNTE